MEVCVSVLDRPVLVLNRSWLAVQVTSVYRAFNLLWLGAAKVVNPKTFSTYDFESWKDASEHAREDYINTVNFKFKAPEVILLTRYNGFIRRTPGLSRRAIFERDRHTCQYCGSTLPANDLTLDHVIARCRGGHTSWDNVVVACVRCNARKGSRTPNEAGMRLLRKPHKPRWHALPGWRVSKGLYSSWEKFLSEAYWETELEE